MVVNRRIVQILPHSRASQFVFRFRFFLLRVGQQEEKRGLSVVVAQSNQAMTISERPPHRTYSATVGPVPATVVRRMSRTFVESKRRARCMVLLLSHITRSNVRHLCEYTNRS